MIYTIYTLETIIIYDMLIGIFFFERRFYSAFKKAITEVAT
jgi:hypothetical protein